jgi:hypothetical protein
MLRLGYSGVHVGWGWRLAQGYSRRNEIAFNRIRHHMLLMDDGGGLCEYSTAHINLAPTILVYMSPCMLLLYH